MPSSLENFVTRGDTLLAAAEYETLGRHLDGILQLAAEISSREELSHLRAKVRHWEQEARVHKAELHKRLKTRMAHPGVADSYRQVAAAS